jgi:hypothetical protein
MRASRSRALLVVLGVFALLSLLGGPGVGGSESLVSEANGAAGHHGVTDSSPGGDAFLAAERAARKGAWAHRVRPPRTVYAFVSLATGAAVVLMRWRRWSLVAGRPRPATSRCTGGVRAPPSLQPA